jgi:hypothetical protein
MPGADSSQYTAFKKYSAASVSRQNDRLSQPVPNVTSGGNMTKFLPSLTIKNTSIINTYFPINVGVPTNNRRDTCR